MGKRGGLQFRKLEHWSAKGRLRVAIYARYSSDLQSPRSIEDQVRDCKARMDDDWVLVAVHSDSMISGDTVARPGYQALLAMLRRGEIDVIMAEGLDRLSRDQEHTAGLYKRACYQEIIIFTLAEGEIEDWHVGIKSVMNAAALTDLALKTRRGLRGRVLAGASAGGLSYGYDVVPVPEGEERGGRTVNVVKAGVVVRIFRDYANGVSHKAIAAALNVEKIPGPSGGTWSQSTINGNRKRGTGILNNELYIGTLVWNRLRYVKDPDSRRRHSRENAVEQVVRVDVPDWRIVADTLWFAAKNRQAGLDMCRQASGGQGGFWQHQRPVYLLSGLLRCGCCGGGMAMISETRVGCSNARNKGEAVCANRRTVKREFVENVVLGALRTRLMASEVYAAFLRGFTAEWNAEQKGRAVLQEGQRDELKRLTRKIGNFLDEIGEGHRSPALSAALREAEARKASLEAELAAAEAPAPRLMPNLDALYRERVAALQAALGGEDAAAARERVRALIAEVRVTPSPTDRKAPPAIEVRGELAAMLALGSGQDRSASEQLERQFKLVAGAGFEPAAFRL